MKRAWLRVLGVALVLSGAACGGDSVSGPSDPNADSTLSSKESTKQGERPGLRDDDQRKPRRGRRI
jgi:hypothetical protein